MRFFKRKRQKPERFEDFINRIPDFDLVQKYSERTNQVAGIEFSDLTFLPYRILKTEIPALLEEGKIEEAIWEIYHAKKPTATREEITQESNYKKLRFFFWIQDQYKAIAKLEETYLSTPPEARMVNAGIRELDILGDVNLIDELAEGDILKWEPIRELPYEQIFNKQLRNVIWGRINKKLAKEKPKHPGS